MITDSFKLIASGLAAISLGSGILVRDIEFCETAEQIEENVICTVSEGCELTIELDAPSSFEELLRLAVVSDLRSDQALQRSGWHDAAALARSKLAARAQAFARQMEHQKARQTMKRRKLLHSDGSFPEWACGR